MAFKRVSTTAFSKVSRVVWGNRFLIDLAVVLLPVKNGMTTVTTVLTKLETPSPITAVVKRLLPGAGRPTLALIPALPKGVVKSTLPLKVKRGDKSKDL